MRKVLTVGVYDLMHIGHILFFKKAKALGDYLIVAVQKSEFIHKYKPNTNLIYNTEERMFMVESLKFVYEVITYTDVDKLSNCVDFDVFAKGPDQIHQGFQNMENWCIEHNKEVIVVPRTEGISSSQLRDYLKDK